MNAQHRHVEHLEVQGRLDLFRVWCPKLSNNIIGYALFTSNDTRDNALLWDIWVQPKFRRNGFGRQLIYAAQNCYGSIWTGVNNTDGDKLLYDCNFQFDKGLHKTDLPKLVWKPEYGTALEEHAEDGVEEPTAEGGTLEGREKITEDVQRGNQEVRQQKEAGQLREGSAGSETRV